MEAHLLDNPLWHMLCHDLAEFTTGTALAKRGDAKLFPVAAIADHSAAAFADFADLFSVGEEAGLIEANPPSEISGFSLGERWSFLQFVCQQRTPIPQHDVEVLTLSRADIPEVAQLIELTQPGPFFPALFERGYWVGIRQQGQLVSVAGQRVQFPGYCEITAVCTHPDWRGRGYAKLTTSTVADQIWESGRTPFLHVATNNTSAIRVYEGLHFVKRSTMAAQPMIRT